MLLTVAGWTCAHATRPSANVADRVLAIEVSTPRPLAFTEGDFLLPAVARRFNAEVARSHSLQHVRQRDLHNEALLFTKMEAAVRTILAIATAVTLTAPAGAQFTNCTNNGPFVNCMGSDGTITNCNRVGNTVNCSSMGGQQSGSAYSGGGAANGIADAIRGFRTARARSRTLKALKANDCATATREALGTDDMNFAQQVQGYCRGQ